MIKAGSLVEFVPTVCIESGENVTIHTVYHRFLDYAKKTKLPSAFYKDTVVSGNWFQKTREDCLVIHHPNPATGESIPPDRRSKALLPDPTGIPPAPLT